MQAAQDLVAEFAPNDYYVNQYRGMERMYLPALFHTLEGKPPGRIIEIGPGWGTTAAWLADAGWDVTVMDREPLGTFMTQGLIDRISVRYVHHDVEDSPTPPETELGPFDLCVMTQVIPHLSWRPDRALSHARSLVCTGGSLVTSVLDRGDYPDLEAAFGDYWRSVPEWRSTEMCMDIVKCMYTRARFEDLLAEVFGEADIWKPPGSTVLFATAVC